MVPFLVLQTLPKPAVFSPNNALLTLARHLDRSRFAMTVAVPRFGLLTDALAKEGIPVAKVTGLRTYRRHDALWRFPKVALQVAHLASRTGALLLVSNHAELGPFAALASRLSGIPWVCFLRQADRPPSYYKKYRVAKSDAVVAVSESALESYKAYLAASHLPSNPMKVISTGIDMPDRDSRHPLNGMSLNPQKSDRLPTVGTVGLREVKRPERFLEIFQNVRHRIPSAKALMIGGIDPDGLARLRSTAVTLGVDGAVEFPGQQPDLGIWYPRMDAYAHTSRSEALPKVILEAMSHALPVVAFDVGGVSEAVSHQETGYLCPEGDLESFSDALAGLLTDPAKARRMGAAGRRRIEQRFSATRMAESLSVLFEELLQSRFRFGSTAARES